MILLCQLSPPHIQSWGGSFSCETGSLYVKTEFLKAIHHSVYCVLAQLLERAQVSKFRLFSWLIAQANVLARQRTWQQALQLIPVINCPKSIGRVLAKVTKLTAPHPQPLHSNPTSLFNSTHPSSKTESSPPPLNPSKDTTAEVSSPQPCYTPQEAPH